MPEETKEEWKLSGRSVYVCKVDGFNRWTARVDFDPRIGSREEAADVARLMRAAKEMAEALEAVLADEPDECNYCGAYAGGSDDHDHREHCAMALVRAALRSAGRLP